MEIIISGEDKKLLRQVETLAKRLGLQVRNPLQKEKMNKGKKSEKFQKLLEEVAAQGELFTSIKDPVAWQLEQREDRALPGRKK